MNVARTWWMIASLAVAMLVGLAAPPATRGAVLCRKRSGALALRDACKRKETQVDPVTIGAVGPPGAAAPELRVLDATGARVGDVTDIFGQVAFQTNGVVVTVEALRTGFGQQATFLHTTADCSGPRYGAVFGATRLVRFGGVLGTTAYYPIDPIIEVSAVARESLLDDPTTCMGAGGTLLPNGLCCLAMAPETTPVGTMATIDLSRFVPPFYAELVP